MTPYEIGALHALRKFGATALQTPKMPTQSRVQPEERPEYASLRGDAISHWTKLLDKRSPGTR